MQTTDQAPAQEIERTCDVEMRETVSDPGVSRDTVMNNARDAQEMSDETAEVASEAGSNDSMRTLAASDQQSRVSFGSYIPPAVPFSTPIMSIARPVDGVAVAMSLHATAARQLHARERQMHNTPASSMFGRNDLRGTTVFGSQNPSPAASEAGNMAHVVFYQARNTAHVVFNEVHAHGTVPPPPTVASVDGPINTDPAGPLTATALADLPKQEKLSKLPRLNMPVRGILKQERSSHATAADHDAADKVGTSSQHQGEQQTSAIDNDQALTDGPIMDPTQRGFEHQIWVENVHEDVYRSIKRLKQCASDKAAIHNSTPGAQTKTMEEFFNEDLAMLLQQAENTPMPPRRFPEQFPVGWSHQVWLEQEAKRRAEENNDDNEE